MEKPQLNSTLKSKIITFLVGLAIGVIVYTLFSFFTSPAEVVPSTKMEELRKQLEVSQRTIKLQRMQIQDIQKQRNSYYVQKEKYKAELDSSMSYIKHLTDVTTTQEDINEALLWIESLQDSLR